VVVATLLLRVPSALALPAIIYDEGNVVTPAWRLLAGEVLYRDVWQIHAPGSGYLLAGSFGLFGTNLLTERVLCVIVTAFTAALLYRFSRLFLAPLTAATVAILAMSAPGVQVIFQPDVPASMFMLAAALALAGALAPGACLRRAVLAGALTSATAIFKHDFAAYIYVAEVVTLALTGGTKRLAVRFHAGIVIVLLPTLLYFVSLGLLPEMWQQMIVFPATGYARARNLPIPEPLGLAVAIARGELSLGRTGRPLVTGLLFWGAGAAILAGAAICVARLRAKSLTPAPLLAVATSILLANYARVRSDAGHLQPVLLFVLPVAGFVYESLRPAAVFARPLQVAGRTTLALAALVWVGLGATSWLDRVRDLVAHDEVGHRVERSGRIRVDAPMAWAIAYLQARVAPGGRIFVGNLRHDRLVRNANLFYFLANRRSVSRYYNLHPGVVTNAGVQLEIVMALRRSRTPWVVMWAEPATAEQNATSHSSGVHILDRYLRSHYRVERSFGAFALWRRRDISAWPSSDARSKPVDSETGEYPQSRWSSVQSRVASCVMPVSASTVKKESEEILCTTFASPMQSRTGT
jgi:hypothetical protein